MKTVSIEGLSKLAGEGAKIIDVRTAAEFRAVHISGSENVPLDKIAEESFSSEEFYLICKSGARAKKAAGILGARGFQNFILVTDGGVDQCDESQFDLSKGETGISLERQVRIAAGLIVLTGSLLTLLVHPHFIAVPLFVGVGLTFAGITDFCGMGLLLARMPWNK